MRNTNSKKTKFPCNICGKNVQENARAICCDFCDNWVHIRCNSISPSKYLELSEEDNDEKFLCVKCFNNELPFGLESDKSLNKATILGMDKSNLENLNVNISKNDKKLINLLGNIISENNDPNIHNSICKYYSIDDFCTKKYETKQYFSIFHLNIESLQFHKNDLDILLDNLNIEFDIIAISETRLKKDIKPVKDIKLSNYEIEDTTTEASKGGTLIYVSKNLNYKRRKDLEIYESKKIESTFIEITNENGKNTIIGCIYKHHTISAKDFTDLISTQLPKISNEKKHCYLIGDFNMNLLQLESNSDIEHYFDVMTNQNFTPLITTPTRITTKTKSLIDNIFFNDFCSNIVSGNLTVGISDHMPQFALIPNKNHKKNLVNTVPRTKYARKTHNINIDSFNQDLDKIDWDTSNLNNVHLYGNNFLNVFNQVLDIHAPITAIKPSKKDIKRNAKPWITNDILKLIRAKDKTYKKFIKEENAVTKEQIYKTYKQQKNDVTKLTRKSKKMHYNEYFIKNNGNLKKLWVGINQILNKGNSTKNIPLSIEIDVDGNVHTITNPTHIANAFNLHYTTVAEKILKKRRYNGNKSYLSYLKKPNSLSFMMMPTSPAEIEDIITKLDTNKKTGPNSLPQQILKSIKKSISTPLSNLFNMSFSEGQCPNFLKISSVIPIYKKDSKLIVTNYRPISLLSNINKILEKLMFNRLYSFLESNKCIYDLQFGFRQKHSTNHALLSMTQQIKDTIDAGNIAVGVFVDFQKAFDTVNHKILLKKLEHYGVRGLANNWFSSYLSNRQQHVTINGIDSETKPISHGVPQGSVLGPLLFLVYINDLNACIRFSTTRHFADDTNLLYIIDCLKQRNRNPLRKLNIDLKSLNQWLLANKISLNAAKTELIYFRNTRTSIPTTNLKLNGVKLQHTNQVKYVGITFDEHMTFKRHITLLNSKLKRANNLLALSRHYLTQKLLIQIYYGQFYSHLTYGCQLWGQNENAIEQTITLQKKAIRLISFAHFQEHASPLFKKLNLLKLTDIVRLNNIVFTHDTINAKTPPIFESYFIFNKTSHQHETVNSLNSIYSLPTGSLKLPAYRTESGKSSIRFICSSTWNTILKDISIKNINKYNKDHFWMNKINIKTLKHILHKHFLEYY